MEWPKPTIFDARNVSPWMTNNADAWTSTQVQAPPRPDFADDEELKKAFGIELGRGLNSFDAGLKIFDQAMPKALWASVHWSKDPVVIASRDAYVLTLKKAQKPLDRDELLAEVLDAARGAEDRERVQFLKLYSEIAGFTGPKIAIDASTTTTNNTNNLTKIVLVKGSQEPSTIQNKAPDMNSQSKIQNSLPTLKLVGGLK